MKNHTLRIPRGNVLHKLAFSCALAMTSLLSFGQTTVTVGTGFSSTDNSPVKVSNQFHYTQCIYTATEIANGGGTGMGTISKIRYYYSSGSYTNSTDWTVYLGHTTKNGFDNISDWITAGIVNSFSGTVTFPANQNWLEITLTTPFQWNGVDNIVVGVDENEPGNSTGSNATWRYSNYSTMRNLFYGSATVNPDPLNPPAIADGGTWAPNIQFEWTAAPTCSGTPAHATAAVDVSTVCAGDNVNLSLTTTPFSTGYSYEWQYDDGSGWQSFASSNATTFSTSVNVTSDFRIVTTCISSALSDTSDIVTVTVQAPPTVVVDVPEAAFCSSSPVAITASGAATYAWAPAAGLNVTTGNTVNANPTSPTTYTITGTDATGCSSTTTAYIVPMSDVSITSTNSPTQICAPGSPVIVQATTNPSIIHGGLTWEYLFTDDNGVVLQNWNSSDSYNFIPSVDSVYPIHYQVRATGCTDSIGANQTFVTVGFGANVSIIDYDCNNLGGTVSLDSIFGQTTVQTVYANPLADDSLDVANLSFNSSASITGGRAVLTPSATGVSGSVTINDPSFHTGLNNAMSLSFKMTADQAINNWGTNGADGLSYSFGDDVTATGHHNGSGSKLRLSFDAAGNYPNSSGIYLVYGYTGVTNANSITPTGTTTLAYSSDVSLWKNKTDAQVDFTITESGLASLTIDGTVVFSNVQLPTAYMTANTGSWTHVFGAKTGGDAMRHAVSDLTITAPTIQYALVPTTVSPTIWQDSTVFSSVLPGTYDVWISSNGSTSCASIIETIEITNANPIVLLGNDTTICEGNTLVLDAGNVGSTYVWSNSQITTQTYSVTTPGAYVAYVTSANGCVGVGSINVATLASPTAGSIFVQENFPNYTMSVVNPQNTTSYTWDFGDGTTLTNAPGSVNHNYTIAGSYTVTVVLSNDCGTETITETLVVSSTVSLENLLLDGLSVYPNPATDKVTLSVPEEMNASATIYSIDGSIVATVESLTTQTTLAVQDWTPGVYFVRVQNENQTSTVKFLIK